jgi:ABC-type multidrug transport system ATPase subunit
LAVPNIVSFVGQLDNHAPYLTVRETFEFAFQCRAGGQHGNVGLQPAAELDAQHFSENMTIEGLDLSVCADTFVGDENVRGVSGGQRRRVTIGEMMVGQPPVGAADEISTGLDAAVTYDIIHSIVAFSKAAQTTRIVSLLQPGPETFSLFDEVIVLAQGKVIYAGPIEEVVDYFAALGYKQPATMDVADFLQSIPTPDGELLLDKSTNGTDAVPHHLSSEGFATAFQESPQHARIQMELETPGTFCWNDPSKHDKKKSNKQGDNDEEKGNANTTIGTMELPKEFKRPYHNSFLRSTQLNLKRHLTLWRRDWGFIIGKIFENVGMAVATGGILFGQANLPASWGPDIAVLSNQFSKVSDAVYGALFMTSLHILLGTMTSAPDEIDGRSIHYKQADSNFYQSFAYMTGRFLSTIPQRSIEIVSFGIPLYWMVGFDKTAQSFFLYLLLLICYTTGLKMNFSILAQTLPKKANVQGVGTFIVLIATLFGGFIVYPSNVPIFYTWL